MNNLTDVIGKVKIKSKTLTFDEIDKTLYVKDITGFVMRSVLYALNMGMYGIFF